VRLVNRPESTVLCDAASVIPLGVEVGLMISVPVAAPSPPISESRHERLTANLGGAVTRACVRVCGRGFSGAALATPVEHRPSGARPAGRRVRAAIFRRGERSGEREVGTSGGAEAVRRSSGEVSAGEREGRNKVQPGCPNVGWARWSASDPVLAGGRSRGGRTWCSSS
jgi:hypothetical protein